MKSLRALAALLAYPDEELIRALGDIRQVVSIDLHPLLEDLEKTDLLKSQERYVSLFDRSRALSLHLFEHVHGESRDRGQAMVDLQAMYGVRGLEVAQHELPDYLPAFLEFLSLLEKNEIQKLLRETSHILRAIGDRLAGRGSRYALIFASLLKTAGEDGLEKTLKNQEPSQDDQALLDAQWMDPEVTFGPRPEVAPVRFYRNGVAA